MAAPSTEPVAGLSLTQEQEQPVAVALLLALALAVAVFLPLRGCLARLRRHAGSLVAWSDTGGSSQ